MLERRNDNGDTPLIWACSSWERNRLAIVRELVQRGGANISTRGDDGRTPFDGASRKGYQDVCDFLLQRYAEQLLLGNEGNLAPHVVLEQANFQADDTIVLPLGTLQRDQMVFLLTYVLARLPAGVRSCGIEGRLPIHVACRQNAPLFWIQWLADQDLPTLRIQDRPHGSLPIHDACSHGAAPLNVMQFLVNRGGVDTLRVRDSGGNMPLHLLSASGNPAFESIKYLITSCGLAVQARTSSGDFPIFLACASSSLSVIFALLESDPEFVLDAAEQR